MFCAAIGSEDHSCSQLNLPTIMFLLFLSALLRLSPWMRRKTANRATPARANCHHSPSRARRDWSQSTTEPVCCRRPTPCQSISIRKATVIITASSEYSGTKTPNWVQKVKIHSRYLVMILVKSSGTRFYKNFENDKIITSRASSPYGFLEVEILSLPNSLLYYYMCFVETYLRYRTAFVENRIKDCKSL